MKRTPLRTRTPLRRLDWFPRSSQPMRKTGLRSKGKRARPVSETIREFVLERSGNSCERCGYAFGPDNPPEFHHIWKRRHVKFDDARLIAALDNYCHRLTEEEPEEAHRKGWHFSAKLSANGVPFGIEATIRRGRGPDSPILIVRHIEEYGFHPDDKCLLCNVAHFEHHEHGCGPFKSKHRSTKGDDE